MRNFSLFVLLFLSALASSQDLVINELDCDTPGIDNLEFIEIKSAMPNQVISNRVLVFFNGSNSGNDSSYFVIDLDGQKTDGNGILLIGSASVAPYPQIIIPVSVIQNGADAVAIYTGTPDDFPNLTPATINNLMDVIVYDTSDADDTVLLNTFRADPRFSSLQQINEGSGNNTNSIKRNNDGTYSVGLPSPRQINEGSGVILNPISVSVDETAYEEGDNFTITFTSELPVSETTTFNITLDNDGFTTGDFSGSTNITFLAGEQTATTFIVLLDDILDEGDEELIIEIQNLEEEFQPTTMTNPPVTGNNFILVRVVDNDFTMAAWGSPLNPTYDQVTSTQPADYYSSLNGKSGQQLRDAITAIIAEEGVVRNYSYATVYNILEDADQNPSNSNEVWMLYTEQTRAKLDRQNTGSSTGKWNREHTFPKSRGDFDEWEDYDKVLTEMNFGFLNTNADSLRHGYSDAHALRVADGPENSRRNNRNYSNNFGDEEYNGAVKSDMSVSTSFRGDVARTTMYMELRYNGLSLVNGFPELPFPRTGELGDLATLLQWHEDDVPDDYEMNRNNIVYEWQRNRNPLIDLPDLVDYIWGDKVGMVYNGALSTDNNELNRFTFYPNPTDNILTFEGVTSSTKIEILSLEGRKVETLKPDSSNNVAVNLASGLYLLKFTDGNQTETKRLVVK
ncbi:endonuclease [Winogradskyella sp.]|uniref:endonuclease n=1 Tax=Winogradskyella sp. TaxID=1883156 RepID=UPI0035C7F81C